MHTTIREYIEANKLPLAPATLLVAVSGGADSVALLHVLVELDYTCVVAHCNFHLRAAESNRDADFVSQLATDLQLPFVSVDFDTTQYAKDKKLSIEMAARDLRYAWFEEMRVKYNAEAIAVAHHADDVVETFLMNITRGTGIHGLTGIKARNGSVIRPFLCVSRLEIENYLLERNIPFVVDSTNLEQLYTRNKFRHAVIPLLEEINPSVKATILDTVERLAEVELIYNNQVTEIKSTLLTEDKDGFSIDIDLLFEQAASGSILYELLSPYGFSPSIISDIIKTLNGESGKQFFSPSHRLLKDRKRLILTQLVQSGNDSFVIEKDQVDIETPIRLHFQTLDFSDVEINKDRQFAFLDADLVQFPLILRKWQDGDFFIPFGMKGRKKISDYFIDNKFTRIQKKQIWVLVSGEAVVWIVGQRIDNRFSISSKTKTVFKIEFVKR